MSNVSIAVMDVAKKNALKCGNSYLLFNGVKIRPSSELGDYVGVDKRGNGYFIYVKGDVAKIVKKYSSVGILETYYYIDGSEFGFGHIAECIHSPFYDIKRLADEMLVNSSRQLREVMWYLISMTEFYRGNMGLNLKGDVQDVIGQLDKIKENYAKMVMYRTLGFKTVRDVNLYKLGWEFDFHTNIRPIDMDIYKECKGCVRIHSRIMSERMDKLYDLLKIMQERLLTDAEVKWIKGVIKTGGK
jgi:hypothetical protein